MALTPVIDPSTPKWFQDHVRRVLVPTAPTKIAEFANAAALPDPADYPACLAIVIDTYTLMISDGAAWGAV